MLAAVIEEIGTVAKVNEVNVRERVIAALGVADEDVLQLEIVVDLSSGVDAFEDLEQLAADLAYCFKSEAFITLQKVMMECLAQLFHDDERVTPSDFLEAVTGPAFLAAQLLDRVIIDVLINYEFATVIYLREKITLWLGEFV